MQYRGRSRILWFFILMVIHGSVSAAQEDWYTYWAVGFASHSYASKVDSFMDDAESTYGNFSRGESASDAFGFYWPFYDDKTIAGFVISGSSDVLTKLDVNEPESFSEMFGTFPYVSGASDYLSIRQDLYGISLMRFYGKEPGDGFYIRGDAGIAKLKIDSDLPSPIENKSGYGLVAGLGYGIPVSEESRVILGLRYSYNRIGSYSYSTSALTIGGLW